MDGLKLCVNAPLMASESVTFPISREDAEPVMNVMYDALSTLLALKHGMLAYVHGNLVSTGIEPNDRLLQDDKDANQIFLMCDNDASLTDYSEINDRIRDYHGF